MSPDSKRLLRNSKSGVLLALLLAASMWFYVERVLVPYQRADAAAHHRPRGNLSDLYPRWLGARELLLHHRNPYSPEITREIQVGYYGRELDPSRPGDAKDQQAFAYPLYVAFLLAPTVGFPFDRVMGIFKWLLLALTAASLWLWLRVVGWRPGPAVLVMLGVLALGSFPALQGFKLQQLSLLVAFLIALSAALLVGEQFFVSGLVLAVATVKPQLMLPLLLCLLLWTASDWTRRQGFLWGFFVGMLVLAGAAELLLPGWVGDFRTATRAYRQYTGGKSLLETLLSPGVGKVMTVAALTILLLVAARFRPSQPQSREFALMVATALGVTLIVIPTFAPYNQLLLLPALLLLVRQWRTLWSASAGSKAACLLTVMIVGWPWMAALGMMLMSVVLSAGTLQQGWAIPLYSSLAIPFVVLMPLGALVAKAWRQAI